MERRERNVSACFSLGFRVLQNLTERYQDDKGKGKKNSLTKVPDCLSSFPFPLFECGELFGL